jgi:hypothetical protein
MRGINIAGGAAGAQLAFAGKQGLDRGGGVRNMQRIRRADDERPPDRGAVVAADAGELERQLLACVKQSPAALVDGLASAASFQMRISAMFEVRSACRKSAERVSSAAGPSAPTSCAKSSMPSRRGAAIAERSRPRRAPNSMWKSGLARPRLRPEWGDFAPGAAAVKASGRSGFLFSATPGALKSLA